MGREWKPGEKWFLEEDTEAVFEHFEFQALKCPGCGLPRDETMADTPEKNLELAKSFEGKVVRCNACAAKDEAYSAFTQGAHNSHGLMVTVRRKDPSG